MREYLIKIHGIELKICQDKDGKFIKPDIIKELEITGTAMKPAHEPILLARKPISEKNVASNVLKWSVGGLNIESCRVGLKGGTRSKGKGSESVICYGNGLNTTGTEPINKGRYPTNLILECCCEDDELIEGKAKGNQGHWSKTKTTGFGEFGGGKSEYSGVGEKDNMQCLIHTNPNCVCKILDEQSGELVSKYAPSKATGKMLYGIERKGISKVPIDNVGGASRFFKQIKVSEEIEECGNILENQKADGILNGVRKEVERYIQNVEQFLCGKKNMENFQKDMKFIISTLIKQMTELKTYSVYGEENINYYMGESEKTIKLLMELNIENAKDVKNIRFLLNFKGALQELIKDIVRNVKEKHYKNGERAIESTITNICKNTTKNIEQNKSFFYQAKASQKEKWFYCTICKEAFQIKEKDNHIHDAPEKTKYKYLEFHPTQKPEKLIEYLVRLITPPNGTIIEPFMGTGTALIAAEREGFNLVGIDSKSEYCQISYKRFENEISQQTKLIGEPSSIEKEGF